MQINQRLSELVAILASVDPASQSVGTVATAWVDARYLQQFMALVVTGVLGASATLDAKIEQATDSSGTGAKPVPSKALAQILKASGDNKQATISFRGQDLDTSNGFEFVRLSITVGTAASIVGGYVLGLPKYQPAGGFNQAAVVQSI